MPSVSIVFRKDGSAGSSTKPAAGEVLLRPRADGDRDRLDLASFVFEQGLNGLSQGDGPSKVVVVPLTATGPTFDDMLAASFVVRLVSGQTLPSGAKAFAHYSAVLRKGLRPSKIAAEQSLEGVYLAIRNSVSNDLTDAKAASPFLTAWSRMAERVLDAAEKNVDPFVTSLFAEGGEFAEERAFLEKDRSVYREDVKRGRQWLACLPCDMFGVSSGDHSSRNGARSSLLILDSPKSLLFKYWARVDGKSPTGDGYLVLGVREEGAWIFSTDPAQRLSLKSLCERLQTAEQNKQPASTQTKTDPWFDGERFAHSLIASPKRGTSLSDDDVLRVVRQWADAAPPRKPLPTTAIAAVACAVVLLLAGSWFWSNRRPAQIEKQRPIEHIESRGEATTAAASDFNPEKGKLLVLSIGADYKKRDVAENACKKDAEKLADAFQSQQGVFFKHVSVTTLLNEQAKKDAILAKLDEIRKEATDGDLVVVTLAGHGTVDEDNNYFFLPFDYDQTKVLSSTGVCWDDFHRAFRPLHCMVLVIADTCHSGAITRADSTRDADEDAMAGSINKAVNEFRQAQAGLIVIAASLAEGVAKQNRNFGYLSQAVFEGVTGQRSDSVTNDENWPKPNTDGLITLETLRWYVINRVQLLSHKSQKVVTNHSGNIHLDDIPIAIRRPTATAATESAQPKL
jgi:Caspase domain